MITIQEPLRIVNLKWELRSQKGGADARNNIDLTQHRGRTVASKNGTNSRSSSSFPLSSELVLLDSKKSIRNGVKNSLSWYRSQNAYIDALVRQDLVTVKEKKRKATLVMKYHPGEEDEDYTGDEVYDDGEEEEEEGVVVEEVEEEEEDEEMENVTVEDFPVTTQQYPTNGNLKKNYLRDPSKKLLELVQRRIQRLVDEKFALPVTNSFKVGIVNTILQDFETDDLSAIYNKLFRKEGKERIIQIIEQTYYDKYPSEQLDYFYDELFQGIGLTSADNIYATHKPSYYRYYADIWRLDSEGFRDYNYQCFVEYCEEQLQQQYDYDEDNFEQSWVHEYVNQGILMNVEKFYTYFYRKIPAFKDSEEISIKLSQSRRSSMVSSGANRRKMSFNANEASKNAKRSIENMLNSKMKKMGNGNENGLQEMAVTMEDEMEGKDMETKNTVVKKSVKFDELSLVLDFCPEEPVFLVQYERSLYT